MGRKDIIMMSSEELRKASVIEQAIDKLISQKKAAEVIGLSYRQTKRLVARVRKEGPGGVIHKSRGKRSNRKIDDKVRTKVMQLYEEKYWDFGPTFASEKLYELDGITVNDETLRLWLVSNEKRDWQRKGRKHRRWRERKQYFGEMVQVDGSHHDWLEGRGPGLVFMGYIDDATGSAFARFYDYEGIMPAMDSFKRYIKKYGIPQSIYIDRHSTYKATRKQTIEEQLNNEDPMTEFERAMKELGVVVIHANSPQAKGRIERAFRTFQDRLIKELRLAGIKSKDEANEFLKKYLPIYNKRFSIPAAKEANLHRKAPGEKELKKVLCVRTKRTLRNDAVIRHNNRFYQIEDTLRKSIKAVIVEDRLDGSLCVRNNGQYLKYSEIDPSLIRKPVVTPKPAGRPKRIYLPVPKDHPWRRFRLKGSPPSNSYQKNNARSKKQKER